MSVDGQGRFGLLDPRQGARLAVAESARNVACAGALPIAATNNLNFGNPQKPEIMWQFAEAVAGIGEACRALETPITGGNVSLYNETDGTAILPTPVLGIVGVIEDASKVLTRTFKRAGTPVVLLGTTSAELGGSEYLYRVHGLIRGQAPALDLDAEKRLQRLLVDAAAEGLLLSAHDCSEGGLAVTLAECCFDTGGIGVVADVPEARGPDSTEDRRPRARLPRFSRSRRRAWWSRRRRKISRPSSQRPRRPACRPSSSGAPAARGSRSRWQAPTGSMWMWRGGADLVGVHLSDTLTRRWRNRGLEASVASGSCSPRSRA